jgi:hypothetical protein
VLQIALDVFEAEWDELVGAKSTRVVVDLDEATVAAREAILKGTATGDVVTNTSGWRQSLKGTKFKLNKCVLWNIKAPTGAATLLCTTP